MNFSSKIDANYNFLKDIENKINKKQSISKKEINRLLEIINSLNHSLKNMKEDDNVLKTDIKIVNKAKELYEKAKKFY